MTAALFVLGVLFIGCLVVIASDCDPTMSTPPPASSDVHTLRPDLDAHADQAMRVSNPPLYVPAEWTDRP